MKYIPGGKSAPMSPEAQHEAVIYGITIGAFVAILIFYVWQFLM